MTYQEQLDDKKIPAHVAIIMDGNGRWAKAHNKERTEGHAEGANVVRTITEAAVELGIKYLTLYTFSTENWNRPDAEVQALMELLFKHIEESIFMRNNVRLRVVGEIDRLSPTLQNRLQECIEKTSKNTRSCLVLAISYSSRWEITNATKHIAEQVAAGSIKSDEIDEKMISDNMVTSFMPDPDLMIRTGGEIRISNFMLWQSAYTEFYFCETYWPDFNKEELCKAIYTYQQRERRFGLTSKQVSDQTNK